MIIILVVLLLAAISNWYFRGGGMESWLLGYDNFPFGKGINAVIYGLVGVYQVHDAWFGLIAAILMYVAQSPKLGEYVAAMLGASKHTVWWGFYRMTLRGLCAGLVLACAGPYLLFLLHTPLPWHFYVVTSIGGAMQGVCYYWPIWAWEKFGWKKSTTFNPWTVSEMNHGPFLWVGMALLPVFIRMAGF
jgi:hypothetical protein